MAHIDISHGSQSEARRKFRYYSRRVLANPNVVTNHEQRIHSALQMQEKEPLQGALADFFYGCWYDMPYHGERILHNVSDTLHPQVVSAFNDFVAKQNFIALMTPLATRWSVLVMPSMNVASHQMRISNDDARTIAANIITNLITAKNANDSELVTQLEEEFFAHCQACNDRMAFSIAWLRLGRENWNFDERWNACRLKLTPQTTQ